MARAGEKAEKGGENGRDEERGNEEREEERRKRKKCSRQDQHCTHRFTPTTYKQICCVCLSCLTCKMLMVMVSTPRKINQLNLVRYKKST